MPETRDPDAVPHLDWPGTLAVVVGLAGLTYALTAAADGVSAMVVASGLLGVLALLAFVLVERRSPHPLVPPRLFTDRVFTVVNAVTLLVYAALGALFVLLVLHLQVVAGYSPLLAGTALLPVTVLMLFFSSRVGALGQRFGARPFLVAGPLVSAVGVLLLRGIGPGAGYATEVLPGAVVFGAGLTLTVAPLTATVLAAAPDRYAGVASGVNNAVARAGGLLAVAVVPVAAGLAGDVSTDPAAFTEGFRTAMLLCAGLLAAGGLLGLACLSARAPGRSPAPGAAEAPAVPRPPR